MWSVSRPVPLRPRVALLITAAVLMAACSGEDEAPAEAAATTTTATGPTVEVPDGVTLTEAGASLEIGDPATAVYADDQRVSVLTVVVSKVVKGSTKDFKSFVLSRRQRASTPYYVSATVTNDGPRQLGQIEVPLYGFDSTDTAFPPTSLVGAFDRCAGGPLPTGFAPGDSVKTCLVYLVPPKATLQAVQLRSSDAEEPISWPID